jgi:hypothetical protein
MQQIQKEIPMKRIFVVLIVVLILTTTAVVMAAKPSSSSEVQFTCTLIEGNTFDCNYPGFQQMTCTKYLGAGACDGKTGQCFIQNRFNCTMQTEPKLEDSYIDNEKHVAQ